MPMKACWPSVRRKSSCSSKGEVTMQSSSGSSSSVSASWGGSNVSEGVDLASVQFRDFYDMLVRAAQAATLVGDGEAKPAAEALSRQLCQLIELQSLEARRIGGKSGIEAEVQGRFLKAALADEVLLNTEWTGRT